MEMVRICDSHHFPAFLPEARPSDSEPPREGAAPQPWSLKGAALIAHHYGMCVVCFETLCTLFLQVVARQERFPCPREPRPGIGEQLPTPGQTAVVVE